MRAAEIVRPLLLAACAAAAMVLGTTAPVAAVEIDRTLRSGLVVIEPEPAAMVMVAIIGPDILVPPEPTYLLEVCAFYGGDVSPVYPANALD